MAGIGAEVGCLLVSELSLVQGLELGLVRRGERLGEQPPHAGVGVIPNLGDGFKSLDNIEAMSFGPKLPNGNRSFYLMSDDNFRSAQRTQALSFEFID